MTEFQKIMLEVKQPQTELNHTGCCTTQDLTQEEIARLNKKPEGF